MLERIEATLERFRIHFDTWERQSEVEAEIPEAVALLDTFEEDGAVWARTSAHGDDKDRVLVRSDGEPTYFAGRRRLHAAEVRAAASTGSIYVLGADHHGYVARLQALAEMLGHPRESLEVLVYQLVHLVEGGEAKKMSKRRGDVVFLDELIDTIGVDAARWYLVSRGHDQTIELDVDLARERTNKNPVYYVQYAHARIAGILRNAEVSDTGLTPVGTRATVARARGARAREAAARVPAGRARGGRAPGAARDPDLRDPRRRRLPPLLPPAPRPRVGAGGVPARPRAGRCSRSIARCLDLVGVDAPERM